VAGNPAFDLLPLLILYVQPIHIPLLKFTAQVTRSLIAASPNLTHFLADHGGHFRAGAASAWAVVEESPYRWL